MNKAILFAIISVLLLSCHDDKLEFSEIDQNTKDWGHFKKGTYWIFENDSTSELDTVKVVIDDFQGQGKTPVLEFADSTVTDLNYKWTESFLGTSLNDSLKRYMDCFLRVAGIGIISWNESYYDINLEINTVLFRLDDNGVISETLEDDYNQYLVEVIDELSLHHNNYKDIIHITIDSKDSNNIYQYWISKNTWIIKKVFKYNDKMYSWTLTESSIVQ